MTAVRASWLVVVSWFCLGGRCKADEASEGGVIGFKEAGLRTEASPFHIVSSLVANRGRKSSFAEILIMLTQCRALVTPEFLLYDSSTH